MTAPRLVFPAYDAKGDRSGSASAVADTRALWAALRTFRTGAVPSSFSEAIAWANEELAAFQEREASQ